MLSKNDIAKVCLDDRVTTLQRLGDTGQWYGSLYVPGHLYLQPYEDTIEPDKPHPLYRRFHGGLEYVLAEMNAVLRRVDEISKEQREAALLSVVGR